MINNRYAFAIEDAKIIEENPNSKFAIVELDFFASGQNLHNLYVSEETLLRTADTIKNCPLVWKYSKTLDDIYTHDKDETVCGFVPETSEIKSRKLPDGRTMLSTISYVWKRYTGQLLDIFKRDGGKKPVSVEMIVYDIKRLPNGKKELTDFKYEGITILGSFVTPAIPLAAAKVLSFSELEKEYAEDYKKEFSETGIKLPESFVKEMKDKTEKTKPLENENDISEENMQEILGHNEPEKEEEIMGKKKVEGVEVENAIENSIENSVEQLSQPNTTETITTDNAETETTVVVNEATAESGEILESAKDEEEEKCAVGEEAKEEDKEEDEEEDEEEDKEENFEAKLANSEKAITEMSVKIQELTSSLEKASQESQNMLSELESLRKFKAEVEESQKSFAVEKVIRELEEKVIIPEDARAEMIADAQNYSFAEIKQWETICKAKSFDFAVRENKQSGVFVKKAGLPFGETTAKSKQDLWH